MTFDYIIIGGGTSGSLVADYLSKKNYKVAIIEKGTNSSFLNHLVEFPNGTFFTLRNKLFTKNYTCESSKNLNGRRLIWPRGEYLGGSSAINGLIYKRGHRLDFDALYKAGFSSWEWKKVIKYYDEIEQKLKIFNCNTSKSDPNNLANPIVDSFVESAKKNNFDFCNSFNERLESIKSLCSYYDLTLDNFKRSYGYNTYLKNNKNIKIFTNSTVTKILFKNLEAIGVQFEKNKKINNLSFNKEIVLSAGTINSPKILQLSGIGDKRLLDSLGIKINFENKNVGINLRDHLQTRLTYEVKSSKNFNYLNKNISYKIKSLFDYLFFKRGMLSLGITRAGAIAGSNHGETKHNYQLNFLLGSGQSANVVDKFNGISMSINTLNPESSGYIKIKSNNPHDDPLIQPNYFSSNVDLDKHINGIEIIRKISKTSPLSEFIIKEHLPGSALTKKQDLIDFIKDTSTTVYHPTGTCRIGDDNKGVVDDKLRVIGIKNLRVCDASIFPESITGNPVASCYLAGMVLVNDIIS